MTVGHVVIGTAGHIDHGKTELVKALTGMDTDRLAEEKARGISIALGFAPFFLPGGLEASIVDVPGHERFVKNMLAGSTGIDFILLVIAADDGVMPQTIEHLAIAEMLSVDRAVAVITKTDLVNKERLLEIQAQVKELLSRTSFHDAPVLAVSAKTKSGLDELIETVEEQAANIQDRPLDLPIRLPIDRSFTLQGAGRVVTGTLWSGVLTATDTLELLPSGETCRPRRLEVRGQQVAKALAGQRVAVNVIVSGKPPRRGDILGPPGVFHPVKEIIGRVTILPQARKALERRTKLRLFHGTKEVVATVSPIDTRRIEPGQTGYARIATAELIVAVFRDRFILRSLSPITTIGGGKVLETSFQYRPDAVSIPRLNALAGGDDNKIVSEILAEHKFPLAVEDVVLLCGLGLARTQKILERLAENREVVLVRAWRRDYYVSAESLTKIAEDLAAFLGEYHARRPRELGPAKDTLRRALWPELSLSQADVLLDYLVSETKIAGKDGFFALPERVHADPNKELMREIIKRISNFSPPPEKQLAVDIGIAEQDLKTLLTRLVSEGSAVKMAAGLYFSTEAVQEAEERLIDYLAETGEITVSEFKELLETTRKYAVPLIEHFDRQKVTRRLDAKLRRRY